MNGARVVELVNEFNSYCNETGKDDLRGFSVWLNRKLTEAPAVPGSLVADEEINRKIVYLTGRLSRYLRFYSRKMLGDFNITSVDDYQFLVSIARLGKPAKNEVYTDTITELTTGTQIMKRLVETNLVKEVADTQDKRVKRVMLTAKGEQTMRAIFARFSESLRLKGGNLPATDREELVRILSYLEGFHNEIYTNDPALGVDELIAKYIF